MRLFALLKKACKSNPRIAAMLIKFYFFVVSHVARLQRRMLGKRVLSYHANSLDSEINEILSFLKKNPVQMVPYEFMRQYDGLQVDVMHDSDHDLPYVIVDNNKVYFPKDMPTNDIVAAVKTALKEQHPGSPHKYLADDFILGNEKTGIFVGASDGIYCLSNITHFNCIYLFEADSRWQEPLKLTFRPWGDTVKIIPKRVSDIDTIDTVTLDTFFSDNYAEITYIQADIEGYEQKLLLGATKLMQNAVNLKMSICAYHGHDDLKDLSRLLLASGMKVSHSYGYMIIWQQVPLKKPYLRRGVILAEKG